MKATARLLFVTACLFSAGAWATSSGGTGDEGSTDALKKCRWGTTYSSWPGEHHQCFFGVSYSF